MFLEVVKAQYLEDFRVKVSFNSGETKIVDFSDKLDGKVFEPLKDLKYFKTFAIKYNTIEWSNGADFAPEYLFEVGE